MALAAGATRTIVLCTAYRVCQTGSHATVGAQTSYSQQRTLLREHDSQPDAWTYWDRHFRDQLQIWDDLDYDIIVMLDANETLHANSDSHLCQTLRQYQLIDAFVQCHQDFPATPEGDVIVTYQ